MSSILTALLDNADLRKTREEISAKTNENNMKFYGSYSKTRKGELQSKAIKEVIRIIDTRENEEEYAKNKCRYRKDFICMKARNAFATGKASTSMIKCAHGFNHYGLREAIINNNMVEAACLRIEKVEIWDHVIKCEKTIKLRKKFIKESVIELAQKKPKEEHVEAIISFAEDILRYLENDEDEECKMNQQHAGMKELFRGYVAIDWEGTNLKNEKYKKLNRISAKRIIEHYDKYWKHQNNEYHYEEK